MSDNVIPFPTKNIRDWTIVSKTIKDILIEGGMTESNIVEFISIFKPIYETFQFDHSLSIPASTPEVATTINNELSNFQLVLNEHTSKLIFERFTRELDIYIKNV